MQEQEDIYFNNNSNNIIDNNINDKSEGNFFKGIFVGIMFSVFAFLCIILLNFFIGNDSEKKTTNNSDGKNVKVESNSGSSDTEDEDDGKFTKIYEKIELIQSLLDKYYYYNEDMESVADSIYKGFLAGLDDKYAVYYDEKSYAQLMESSNGSYYGIGCAVTQDIQTGIITVVQPYKDCPAYEAGISIGDIILKVNDKEVTGMDLSEAVSYIKGDKGTYVSITYLRGDEEKTVQVERREISVPTVAYEMKEGNIGYIQISSFDKVTVKQFEEALNDLIAQGAKGLIFDVRSNPGGLYESVVSMLDTLLPEGVIVYTEDKYQNRSTKESGESCIEMPMSVLINGDSASASEIFAGALKDFDWAEIIGTKSYGKGIVQSVIPLSDNTAVKFTISSYFLPSGVCIQDVGIEPDKEIELPEEEEAYDESGYLKPEYDTQLNAAIEYINGEISKK